MLETQCLGAGGRTGSRHLQQQHTTAVTPHVLLVSHHQYNPGFYVLLHPAVHGPRAVPGGGGVT
jgi:hypothetical protein